MSRITWDNTGSRFYEAGVDHGVLYTRNPQGAYTHGVPWNGLVSVSENPSGAEASPYYADNIKYLNLVGAEEWSGTIEAFTYPDEFAACEGSVEVAAGIFVAQQNRESFGFVYRTIIGNDVAGQSYGYKLHAVYGAQAAPSQKQRQTISENVEPVTFSWEISTTPAPVTGLRPTATLTFDSTKISAAAMQAIEEVLFGSETAEPRLPDPDELIRIGGGQVGVTSTTTTSTTSVTSTTTSTTTV